MRESSVVIIILYELVHDVSMTARCSSIAAIRQVFNSKAARIATTIFIIPLLRCQDREAVCIGDLQHSIDTGTVSCSVDRF